MKYNHAQISAIEHKDGPMLVLAGPGSGKTATLVERTKNLIVNHGINPSNILVITFTKAAAHEMQQRFEREIEELQDTKMVGEQKRLPYGTKGFGKVTFGTFHAVFFMILKLAYHYEASNIVTEDVRRQVIREAILHYGLDFRDENELISGILGEIGVIKNSRISLEHFYSTQCGETVFRKIYKQYEDFLRKHRLIDFDDMLLQTHELFTQRPDILQAWQRKYQ